MATRAELAHLLRRATFGPRAEELDAAERVGFEATVAGLIAPAGDDPGAAATPPPTLGLDPVVALAKGADRTARQNANQQQRDRLKETILWWLDRMVAADQQFTEKLVFFWHGHWATSADKVRDVGLLLSQQQTLRRYGRGDFRQLLLSMLADPALIIWLDGQRNVKGKPNENLAREVMELFSLGVGNYTENDVKAAAQALTGWQVDQVNRTAAVNLKRYDAGVRTILGRTGPIDATRLADILTDDPANATFLAARLWFRFASGDPLPTDTRDRLTAAYRPRRDITALVKALFTDPRFPATRGALAKQPVEWAVGAMRQLGIRPGTLPAAGRQRLLSGLAAMGQTPLDPPSVGGWPAGQAWLTTSATEYRLRLAAFLATQASPTVRDALAAAPAAGRPDALARLLVVDRFTDRTRTVLAGAAQDPTRLLALGLASPEYAVC